MIILVSSGYPTMEAGMSAVDYVVEAIEAVVEAKNRSDGSQAVGDLELASEALARAETTLESEEDTDV